jgi:ABC-2 type transport system permease protein
LRNDPDPTKPLALLLEGEFTSHYKGRIIDKYVNDPTANYLEKSKTNKMVVIGDGDLIRNELGMSEKGKLLPYGLQFEPLVRDQNNQVATMYGNGIFFTNLMDRMMGNEHLISLRSRMKIVRLLNREEVSLNRRSWQTFNLTIPVILVVLLGLVQWYIRRRKFALK